MAPSSEPAAVLWSVDRRGVATVTLNRPEVNNAYDGALIAGLHAALEALDREPALRLVVLRGNGRHFQAGADLTWVTSIAAKGTKENEQASRQTAEAITRLEACPVPTLALIHGGCFGGGTGIAAACDIVIASEDAVFSISETRWGLMAGIILPQLARAIGVRQVRRYALTGERFGAAEAKRLGLVHEVCPTGALDEAGGKIVESVLMNAPLATRMTKRRTLAVAHAFPDPHELQALIKEHAHTRQQPEASEGLASFREKRKPRWYPD